MNITNVYNYIWYYYIDENGNFAQTEMIKFNRGTDGFINLPNWSNEFPLFFIDTDSPDSIDLKKNSYVVTALKGPDTNIYDKYIVYSNRVPLNQSFIDEPLAREIDIFQIDQTTYSVVHGETISNTNTINRYVGYYEPIFKSLSMFEPTYYWKNYWNGTYSIFNKK